MEVAMEHEDTCALCVFRWDLSLIDNLPNYMKIALEIFFKTSNELIAKVLKEKG